MESLIAQIGVGGIFAVLVIRIVLDFLGKNKRNGRSGELDPEYWKAEFRRAIKEEVREDIRDMKSMLGKILDRLPKD